MLTHAQRKAVTALHRKKRRHDAGRFLVEGRKCVEEVLGSDWEVDTVFATVEWRRPDACEAPVVEVEAGEMRKLSALETPQCVLAVVCMPEPEAADLSRGRWLGLDGIRDPGNLGTILRLADWFGLDGVVCSPDCVDWSNPKVVQASMGSLFRVGPTVRDLPEAVGAAPWAAGAVLDGRSVYGLEWPEHGMLVLGNESHGIRPETLAAVEHRLTIPRWGGAESLNAAMSAAIFCSEWRRMESV